MLERRSFSDLAKDLVDTAKAAREALPTLPPDTARALACLIRQADRALKKLFNARCDGRVDVGAEARVRSGIGAARRLLEQSVKRVNGNKLL